ncbi:MAG: glycosyltransferase 87 family protein [Actinomycetota bacterium]
MPKTKRSSALIVCGVALVLVCADPILKWAWHGFGLHPAPVGTSYANRSLVWTAAIPYIACLILLQRSFELPTKLLITFGALGMVLLIPPPPLGSQDVFSYIFYGKMAVHGVNPLALAPIKMQHDPWFQFVLWKHAPSVYGPVWIYVCTAIAFVSGSHIWIALILMKLVASAGVLTAALFLSKLAGNQGRRSWIIVACLWNPLVLFSTANTAHVDGVLLALVAAALYTRNKDRTLATTLLLSIATLIKIYCGIFLGLYLLELAFNKRNAIRMGLISLGAVVLAYAPSWRGRSTFAGIYQISGAFSHTLAEVLREHTSTHFAQAVSSGFVALAIGVSIWIVHRTRNAPLAWGVSFGTYLLVAPWLLPWHDLPLIGIALAQAEPAGAGAPLTIGALAFSLSTLTSQPVVRYSIPIIAAGFAHALTRSRPRSKEQAL